MQLYHFKSQPDQVAPHAVERLDAQAAVHWDRFYKSNKDRFFKDRHYLHKEFPLLLTPELVILEVRAQPSYCSTGGQ